MVHLRQNPFKCSENDMANHNNIDAPPGRAALLRLSQNSRSDEFHESLINKMPGKWGFV